MAAHVVGLPRKLESDMHAPKVWRKPRIVEIAVGLEINAYACAEL